VRASGEDPDRLVEIGERGQLYVFLRHIGFECPIGKVPMWAMIIFGFVSSRGELDRRALAAAAKDVDVRTALLAIVDHSEDYSHNKYLDAAVVAYLDSIGA
jgi:hypothetical protein